MSGLKWDRPQPWRLLIYGEIRQKPWWNLYKNTLKDCTMVSKLKSILHLIGCRNSDVVQKIRPAIPIVVSNILLRGNPNIVILPQCCKETSIMNWLNCWEAARMLWGNVFVLSQLYEGASLFTQVGSPSLGQQAQRTDMWWPSLALGTHVAPIPSLRAPHRS